MALNKLRPVTPGTRFANLPKFEEITVSKPYKPLTESIKKSGGRNNQGKMTMRYIGGGHKRLYRIIDFKRNKFDIAAEVTTIEYDPNRTSYIALLEYADGEKRYIIAPENIKVGMKIISGVTAPPEVGNSLQLINMPLGTIVHNIEINPGRGGQLARSAGTYAQLVGRDGKYCILKMPSGETRLVLGVCMATVGTVSNGEHSNVSSGKAGRSRWLGRRPRVRGVAMNPVDHPMGGGEGRASGGHPRSRKGLYAKGKKTRAKKNPSNRLIISKRKK